MFNSIRFIISAFLPVSGVLVSVTSAREEPSEYPLHEACCSAVLYEEDSEEVEKTLQMIYDAKDVNIVDENGETPLHYCRHSLKVAKALLVKGANINKRSQFGTTPLHIAAQNDDNDFIAFYVQHGAKIGYRDWLGRTAMDFAPDRFYEKDGKTLKKYFQKKEQDLQFSLLHAAAGTGDTELIEQLLHQGVDTSATDQYGETALHKAVSTANSAAAAVLIKHRASVLAKDIDGRTPLHLAAKTCPDAIPMLLKNGAIVNAKDRFGITPLHIAAANNNIKSVVTLLENGADINDRKDCGITPLHAAAMAYGYDVIPVLLNQGADINITSDDGMYAYEYIPVHCDEQADLRILLGDKEE